VCVCVCVMEFRMNEEMSYKVQYGVPQGSVLGYFVP